MPYTKLVNKICKNKIKQTIKKQNTTKTYIYEIKKHEDMTVYTQNTEQQNMKLYLLLSFFIWFI